LAQQGEDWVFVHAAYVARLQWWDDGSACHSPVILPRGQGCLRCMCSCSGEGPLGGETSTFL